MRNSIAIAIGCIFAATFAFGETYTVTSNADSGDGTLRALLAASAADDEIVIPANMTITLESVLTLPKWNLTIRGNGKTSIVSGNNAVPIFEVDYGKTVRYELKDFVLEKGFCATGGAGLKLTAANSASIVMNDCIVRDLSATPKSSYQYQLGVFLAKGGNGAGFYATNTVFSGMSGGAAIMGSVNNSSNMFKDFVLSSCQILDNGEADGNECYSLFHLSHQTGGQVLIDKCIIADNVTSNCGAIVVYDNNNSGNDGTIRFRDCVISNNVTATGNGMFEMKAGGRLIVEGCRICDNRAGYNVLLKVDSSFGHGAEFHGCTIERNESTKLDTGYYSKGFMSLHQKSVSARYPEELLISNCVIRENVSLGQNFIGYHSGSSRLRCVDTLFQDNSTVGQSFIYIPSNTFVRCSFVSNFQDPVTTKTSGGDMFAGSHSLFDSCLVCSNKFIKPSYVISTYCDIIGCTIVSNSCKTGGIKATQTSSIVNSVVAGSTGTDSITAKNDVEWTKTTPPAMTNCYFEKATAAIEDQKVYTGKSAADLCLDCTLTTDGSKTVFLDGTRMPYMAFAKGSLLRDAGVAHALLGPKDVRGKRRDSKPDIGCYEYPNPSLTVIVR